MSTPPTNTLRTVPAMLLAGAAALALTAAVLLSSPGGATAEESSDAAPTPAGPMQDRAHGHGHADRDPQVRAEHLADLAGTFGVDADALADTMAARRADLGTERMQMREEMAELGPDERRAAMTARSEQRRGMMVDALAELGVDADALAEHRADRDHADRAQHQQRGAQRMAGPHGQV